MSKLQRLRPCSACPWRIEARVEDIPNYDVCKAQGLAPAVEQGFNKVMACHDSPAGGEYACAGFMQSPDALNNFTVRLMVVSGQLRPLDPIPGFYRTYAAMAEAKWPGGER